MTSLQNVANAVTPLMPIPVSNFLNLAGNPTVGTGVLQPWRRRNILPFINDLSSENKPSIGGELSQINNDNQLKAAIKQLGEKSLKSFAKISADIMTHLDISRRDYHLILRTSVGKQIESSWYYLLSFDFSHKTSYCYFHQRKGLKCRTRHYDVIMTSNCNWMLLFEHSGPKLVSIMNFS